MGQILISAVPQVWYPKRNTSTPCSNAPSAKHWIQRKNCGPSHRESQVKNPMWAIWRMFRRRIHSQPTQRARQVSQLLSGDQVKLDRLVIHSKQAPSRRMMRQLRPLQRRYKKRRRINQAMSCHQSKIWQRNRSKWKRTNERQHCENEDTIQEVRGPIHCGNITFNLFPDDTFSEIHSHG